MTERKPQVGEVWTSTSTGRTHTCILSTPDTNGRYVFVNPEGQYVSLHPHYITPPPPQPPEWLADRWVNVHPGGSFSVPYLAASTADASSTPDRIGRVSLTGQWVPCDGKRVLA